MQRFKLFGITILALAISQARSEVTPDYPRPQLPGPATTEARPEHHLGFNFGFAASKGLLGGHYAWGRHQVNLGSGYAYSPQNGFERLQPILTYNHYLSRNGLYANAGISSQYARSRWDKTIVSSGDTVVMTSRRVRDSWDGFALLAGFGKTWRYRGWGIHLDATLTSPYGNWLEPHWSAGIGAGASYRFRLD